MLPFWQMIASGRVEVVGFFADVDCFVFKIARGSSSLLADVEARSRLRTLVGRLVLLLFEADGLLHRGRGLVFSNADVDCGRSWVVASSRRRGFALVFKMADGRYLFSQMVDFPRWQFRKFAKHK